MADSSLSSDLEHEASPSRPSKHKTKSGKQSASSSRTPHQPKASSSSDKDALRHHKALERQYNKTKQAVSMSLGLETQPLQHAPLIPRAIGPLLPPTPPSSLLAENFEGSGQPLALSKGVSLSMPDVSAVGLSAPPAPQRKQPEATFTLLRGSTQRRNTCQGASWTSNPCCLRPCHLYWRLVFSRRPSCLFHPCLYRASCPRDLILLTRSQLPRRFRTRRGLS